MPVDKLRLYVNPAWRREGIHSPLLNPWWGNPYPESAIFGKELFDTYEFDTKYYTITDDIQAADMVFPPYPQLWLLRHDTKLFDECVQTATQSGLSLFIDGLGDIETPVEVGNAYILRYGGYRFLPERGSINIFPLADDLLERYRGGQLNIRKKGSEKPIIGFAGWATLSFKQHIRTVLKELPVRLRSIFDTRYRACIKGVLWRQKAIQILKDSSLVDLRLHERRSFSANPKTAMGDMRQLREEMIDTILKSDYALDVRGDANNSTRLLEILSLGRIPVIVDTERNFPFKDKIDYSSFALIVDFRDIKRLPERIAEFHKNTSPEHFEQMQRNARETFVRYFRIDMLVQLIIEELRTRMARVDAK